MFRFCLRWVMCLLIVDVDRLSICVVFMMLLVFVVWMKVSRVEMEFMWG